MSDRMRRGKTATSKARGAEAARRLFGPMTEDGARAYVRARDLPQLIPLWPHELEDRSREGSLHLIAKLRRALSAERRRAQSGHWSYDLNRHLGLLSAYKGELARLRLEGPKPLAALRSPRDRS